MTFTKIQKHVQDLISELEYLSQIKEGKKPCQSKKIFFESDSWWGSVYRTIYREGKIPFINHIKNTIEIYATVVEEHPEYKKILEPLLISARSGIVNLCQTYQDDPEFNSEIKVVMMLFELNLNSPSDITETSSTNKDEEIPTQDWG